MKTIWDDYKTIDGAKRQAQLNKMRGNTWTHVRLSEATKRYVLQNEATARTLFSAR